MHWAYGPTWGAFHGRVRRRHAGEGLLRARAIRSSRIVGVPETAPMPCAGRSAVVTVSWVTVCPRPISQHWMSPRRMETCSFCHARTANAHTRRISWLNLARRVARNVAARSICAYAQTAGTSAAVSRSKLTMRNTLAPAVTRSSSPFQSNLAPSPGATRVIVTCNVPVTGAAHFRRGADRTGRTAALVPSPSVIRQEYQPERRASHSHRSACR